MNFNFRRLIREATAAITSIVLAIERRRQYFFFSWELSWALICFPFTLGDGRTSVRKIYAYFPERRKACSSTMTAAFQSWFLCFSSSDIGSFLLSFLLRPSLPRNGLIRPLLWVWFALLWDANCWAGWASMNTSTIPPSLSIAAANVRCR